jgi:hypothetical protein
MKTMTKKTTKSRWALLAAIVSLSLGGGQALFAQGVSINGTGARADTSAMLDVSSTTKGTLIPRMSTVQRNAIVLPATGLMIWNTTTKCLNTYLGSFWKETCGNCDFTAAVPSYGPSVPQLNSTLSLFATTVSGATYFWTGPNSFTSSSQNPTIANAPAAAGGTYYLTTTVGGCASAAATVTVPAPSYTPVVTSFSYNGGQQTWVVPSGSTGIIYDMRGSQGSPQSCYAGQGGRVQGKTAVSAGTTLYLYVGGYANSTSNGFNGGAYSQSSSNWGGGGGGGGASDIRVGSNSYGNRIAVAGGGGGGGNSWDYGCKQPGSGGGLTGGTATSSGSGSNWSGQGGTQSSGGWGWNSNGSLGDGGSGWCGGGGGGGGYYGGGGGGWNQGGGGGSNYVDASASGVTHTQGGNTTYGSISITTY